MGLVQHLHKGTCVGGRKEPVQHYDDLLTHKKTRARIAALLQQPTQTRINLNSQKQSLIQCSQQHSNRTIQQFVREKHSYQPTAGPDSTYNTASSSINWSEAVVHRHQQLSHQVIFLQRKSKAPCSSVKIWNKPLFSSS